MLPRNPFLGLGELKGGEEVLLKYFADKGHEVHLITTEPSSGSIAAEWNGYAQAKSAHQKLVGGHLQKGK